jgi:hypothetical protein
MMVPPDPKEVNTLIVTGTGGTAPDAATHTLYIHILDRNNYRSIEAVMMDARLAQGQCLRAVRSTLQGHLLALSDTRTAGQ